MREVLARFPRGVRRSAGKGWKRALCGLALLMGRWLGEDIWSSSTGFAVMVSGVVLIEQFPRL